MPIIDESNISEVVDDFRSWMIAFKDSNQWTFEVIKIEIYKSIPELGERWGTFKIGDPFSFFRNGLYHLTAHSLSVSYGVGIDGDASKITPDARMNPSSKSVADTSIQYRITEIQPAEDDWLSLTNYGVIFLRLRSTLIGGFSTGGVL